MKRFFCMLLVAMMAVPCAAYAESVGEYLNRQTTEDLIIIREYIDSLIKERQENDDGFVIYNDVGIKYKSAYIQKSGGDKLVVVFDWINNSDSAASFGSKFDFEAYQDGVSLSVGIIWNFDTEFTTKIMPGKTMEGYYIWELRNTKEPVTVVFDKAWDFSNKYPNTEIVIDLSQIETKK